MTIQLLILLRGVTLIHIKRFALGDKQKKMVLDQKSSENTGEIEYENKILHFKNGI